MRRTKPRRRRVISFNFSGRNLPWRSSAGRRLRRQSAPGSSAIKMGKQEGVRWIRRARVLNAREAGVEPRQVGADQARAIFGRAWKERLNS